MSATSKFYDTLIKHDIRPKCEGRTELFADYHHAPTQVEAQRLCAGCPLLALCADMAQEIVPKWGVWGGKTWGAPKKRLAPESKRA